jgi:hypothetical protein
MTPGAAYLILIANEQYRNLMTRLGVEVVIIHDLSEAP